MIAGATTVAAMALAAVAWTQVRDLRPTPTEIALSPTRAEAGALAEARQAPLAARLRLGMSQGRAAPALRQIETSTVPVLAPPDPSMLQDAIYVGGERHYMLVIERGDRVLEIYGAAMAFQSPYASTVREPQPQETSAQNNRVVAAAVVRQTPPAAALRRARAAGLADILVEQTEYGVDVSFRRFGAAYSLSLICENPEAPACGPAEAVALAASLQLIGGGEP